MDDREQEVVFVVRLGPGGWLVEDGVPLGPFYSKQRAVELATGMAMAVNAVGHRARVEVK